MGIVEHQHHRLRVRVALVQQPPDRLGKLLAGAPLGDLDVAPADQRLTDQEAIADSLTHILVILAGRVARFSKMAGAPSNTVRAPIAAAR